MFKIFVITIFLLSVFKPVFNWDMVAYLASSLRQDFSTAADLHTHVWLLIKASASDAQFYKLSAGNPYNLHAYQNATAFVSQLPMFDMKVGYVGTLRSLGWLMGPVHAAIAFSAVTALLFGVVCFQWMSRQNFLQVAPIVALFLLLSGYLSMGRTASPDMAVALFILIGTERFMRGRDQFAALALFVAFMFRPDVIFLIFAILLITIIFNHRIRPYLFSFVAACTVSIWLASAPDHPGWWTHYYSSCFELQNNMIGFDPDFSLLIYVKGFARGAVDSLKYNNWPILLGLLITGWLLLTNAGYKISRKGRILIWAILLSFAGKFVVFPMPDDRLYMPLIIVFLMVLLETWKPRFDGKPQQTALNAG